MIQVTEVAPERLDFDANLFQCALWARFKERRRHPVQTFHVEHAGTRFPLVLVHRPITADAVVGYAPHGPAVPVPQDEQGPFLEAVSEELRPLLPCRCRFLRYDLPWPSPYAAEGGWSEPPEPRVREMRMNFGCRCWKLRKAPTDLQAPDTVILDLAPPPETLLMAMHKKHRYCIRAATRRGVEVSLGGAEDVASWHRLHLETGERQGIAVEELAYFQDLLATAARHDPVLRLYVARRSGRLLAGCIVALVGSTAFYLFSAASAEGRSYFASFAVLWRAITDARRDGCRTFDLMGIPPDDRSDHPMHGLYRFKTRFGGRIHHRRGCWDFPVDERAYPALAFAGDLQAPLHGR